MVVTHRVLGPSVDAIKDDIGNDGIAARIVIGATWDVAALLAATSLSVYKPGRVFRRGA